MKLTYSLSEIDIVAKEIISTSTSNILLFYGNLGEGKTTLIKALCKALGVSSRITSPTFSLVNEYVTADSDLIFHFDFYRIENEEEVLDIGFDQYIKDGKWIFIEWPEKISNLIPENSQKVQISRLSEKERTIVIF